MPIQAYQRREAVLGGAARHGEAAVRAGVGRRERLAEHVRHPREALPHGVPVIAVAAAPVLRPSAQPPRDLLQEPEAGAPTTQISLKSSPTGGKPNGIERRRCTVACAHLVLGDEGELRVHLVRGRVRLQQTQQANQAPLARQSTDTH